MNPAIRIQGACRCHYKNRRPERRKDGEERSQEVEHVLTVLEKPGLETQLDEWGLEYWGALNHLHAPLSWRG